MSVNKMLKLETLQRDKYICQYCGENLILENIEDIHLDHFVSKINGGKNEIENMKTSCKRCNCSKNYKDIEIWRSELIKKFNKNISYLNSYGFNFKIVKDYKFYFERK